MGDIATKSTSPRSPASRADGFFISVHRPKKDMIPFGPEMSLVATKSLELQEDKKCQTM